MTFIISMVVLQYKYIPKRFVCIIWMPIKMTNSICASFTTFLFQLYCLVFIGTTK